MIIHAQQQPAQRDERQPELRRRTDLFHETETTETALRRAERACREQAACSSAAACLTDWIHVLNSNRISWDNSTKERASKQSQAVSQRAADQIHVKMPKAEDMLDLDLPVRCRLERHP